MKSPFFCSKPCFSEIELNDYHKLSTLNSPEATKYFYIALKKALTSYENRIFSVSSTSSKTLLTILSFGLSHADPNFAFILGEMTKFLSSKNKMIDPGELYQRLLPLWRIGMQLLCLNTTSLEDFMEICDDSDKKILSLSVYTHLKATGRQHHIKVGEYLMALAEHHHQEYAQCLLINRGIYPKCSENLPQRFVSIDESFSGVRDSLELYCHNSVSSGASASYYA